jgi:replication initiation protein RepC
MNAALMKHQAQSKAARPPAGTNKYEVLRELAAAKDHFALSDRDIGVLQALVSFHHGATLGGNQGELVVHPSNKAICERLNGMPTSTMRRHVARLVQNGIILRRDSPNGKRYARRYGEEKVAFGFDLSPLVVRLAEFCEAAEVVRATEQRHRRLREAVSLMRRDLASLAEYGASLRPDLGLWDRVSDMARLCGRDLRRKLDLDALVVIERYLSEALVEARRVLEPHETVEMSTNDAENEHHYQNSKADSYVSEPCIERARAKSVGPERQGECSEATVPDFEGARRPNLPLGLVTAACKEIATYTGGPVRHWHELVRAADLVRPMMGISPSAWDEAKAAMGPEEAAVVVAAMLERFGDIRAPGGYLRNLSAKAAAGAFSSGPMVMALMRKDAA